MSLNHYDDLVEAVKDGELWNRWYAAVPHSNDMEKEINRRLALQKSGTMLPFAVIENKTGKAIGMTTYCQIDAINKRLDIGFTWYAQSHQRTAINSECKLMLLTHAFEVLKTERQEQKKKLKNASLRVRQESMKINDEFSEIEDEPES